MSTGTGIGWTTGTSPCDQKTANASIPHLMRVPGRRFLSCEPLLGKADVPVFHKQATVQGRVSHDPSEWPEWARVQQFPEVKP